MSKPDDEFDPINGPAAWWDHHDKQRKRKRRDREELAFAIAMIVLTVLLLGKALGS